MAKKLFYFILIATLSGCHLVNPNVMFKTGIEYPYNNFSKSAPVEYKIAARDNIEFFLYTNDGAKLIDIGLPTSTAGGKANLTYSIERDGNVKLPLLGRTKLEGYTIKEAATRLEELYSKYFVKPFIILQVTNRKVTIFPGSHGNAKVLVLQNESTTLLEAIAEVGGLPQGAKSHRIKLIRKNNGKTDVQLIDLSTIKNIEDANIVLQSNDIIYIQPASRISQGVLQQLTPVLTLISTILLSLALYQQITK